MTPGFKTFTINYLTWFTTSQQLLERVAVIFLKDQLVVWIACYFTAFMILKTLFGNTLYFQNALNQAIMAGTQSLKRFLKNTPGTEKHKDK